MLTITETNLNFFQNKAGIVARICNDRALFIIAVIPVVSYHRKILFASCETFCMVHAAVLYGTCYCTIYVICGTTNNNYIIDSTVEGTAPVPSTLLSMLTI